MNSFLSFATAALACTPLLAQVDPRGRSILFVRGADGTGGLGGGTFEQRTRHLSDVADVSQAAGNTGFGELAALLRADGFAVSQRLESAQPLTMQELLPHRVVVLGSNNKVYAPAEIAAFHAYVDAGGSALFASDANWGPTFGAAPASDNQFLERYGMQVWQDNAEINTVARAQAGRFVVPGHPALAGPDGAGGAFDVNVFEGEGVSHFAITAGREGWQATILVHALGFNVRLHTIDGSPGPARPADPIDCAMCLAQRGRARVLGYFDRNSFFNRNGAGTDLHRHDHVQLALDLFRFLAAEPAAAQAAGAPCALAPRVPLLATTPPVLSTVQTLSLANAAPRSPGAVLLALGPAQPAVLPGGCVLQVPLAGLLALPAPVTDAAGAWQLGFLLPPDHAYAGQPFTVQAATVVAGGPALGTELSNGVVCALGYP
jgi:hypothetical protein